MTLGSTIPAVTSRAVAAAALLRPLDAFVRRHVGPSPQEVDKMLKALGVPSLFELTRKVVPDVCGHFVGS